MNKEQPTREKILDGVFELVYIHGYNGTSMSMILRACGIPKGSLYHFFKSKKAMVLSVIKERLGPKMDSFFTFEPIGGKDGIDAITETVLSISKNPILVKYGCPLNRLNQEMSPVDDDFDREITLLYDKLKEKIVLLLSQSNIQDHTDIDSLADFVIEVVWGALSLSPKQSSSRRYLHSVKHLISYLRSLRK